MAAFRKTYAVLALVHVFLVGYQAVRNSPTRNENSHLAAGVSHWEFLRFDLFRVNPPLVRAWAAIPVVIVPHKENWSSYSLSPTKRREASVGQAFAEANGARCFQLMTYSRWMCIPFGLIGGWICGRWAMRLYGLPSGILAMLLWFFSPTVLGNASLITADAHSAALGVTAMYAAWNWLTTPTRESTLLAGAALGLAELAKHTLLILYPVVCVLAILFRFGNRKRHPKLRQFVLVLLVSLLVVNFGYLFEDSFKRLKEYRFQSQLFTGLKANEIPDRGAASRFRGTLFAETPIPVPANYLQGIDTQRLDFERPMGPSYLCGTWQERGWWYWYLCAFCFKTPLGTLALLTLAFGISVFGRRFDTLWKDELCVWLPAIGIVAFVSSQTGFTIHYRYMLPALPFLFVGISKTARAFSFRQRKLAIIVAGLALTTLSESLWAFPHCLSFFNSAIGGPRNGHEYLVDSNIDWGQDLLYLRRWQEAHPQAYPLHVCSPEAMTAGKLWPRPFDSIQRIRDFMKPGWYALSVNSLCHTADCDVTQSRLPSQFLRFDPVATAGYSIFIYHITLEEANRVRREVALPELPANCRESGADTEAYGERDARATFLHRTSRNGILRQDTAPPAATAQTHDLHHRAREFGLLQWDLFHAPTVDATLVDVGRRLLEIAPENQRFKELHEKLTRFAARHAQSGFLPAAPWASPPQDTPWGCPVEWLSGFGDVKIADTADPTLLGRFAGDFFPAFGLALQGLERAAICIGFVKDRSSRGLGLKQTQSAWGLDLSVGGLKAVRLDVGKKDGEVVVGACDLVEHRKPLGQATGPDERQQLVAETLEVFRKRIRGRLGRMCMSLPDMRSIARQIRVPPTSAEKLAEVMQHQSRMHLGQRTDDQLWDYQPLERADEASPHRQRRVLLVAIRKSILQTWLEAFQKMKLRVDQVQVDWLAMANALVHLGHLPSPELARSPGCRQAVAVLDVGSETSQLVVEGPGFLDVRPVRVGGFSFTRALAREFQLPLGDAEALKRDPRSLELLSRFEEAIRPVLDDLVHDVKAGLKNQCTDETPPRIARLLAVGGEMRLHGLWRHLLSGR